jgi:hypothetical protein
LVVGAHVGITKVDMSVEVSKSAQRSCHVAP